MPSTAGSGPPSRTRVGVFISGRGSNLRALIEASAAPHYPAEIVLVVSNRGDAAGLEWARRAGIPAVVIAESDRGRFAAAAEQALREHAVGLVALAGFMRILDTGFVDGWRDRLLNIHPSLLPAFPGLHPQRQALAAGVRFAGCTVHFVRPEMDSGPIIAQAVVPVHDGDDEERLSARILSAEHRLYPLALRLVAEGRLRIDGNRVVVAGGEAPAGILLNPREALVGTDS